MEKKDLYLDDEQIGDIDVGWAEIPNYGDKQWGEDYYDAKGVIARTSADNAVKQVVNLIENPFEGYVDAFENIRLAKAQGFERFREALKKLVA